VKVDGATRQALILCSLTVLPGYRLAKNPSYPGIAADYERSYATWTTLPCDVFLGSHGQFFRMAEKRAAMKPGAPNPFVDPEGCKTYFAAAKARFDAELKKQQAEP
jgi:metallo-beta-lactamase class B